MTCTEEEKIAIKVTAVNSGFNGSSEYIRSLVTADIIAKKKALPDKAWRYGEGFNDWQNLSEKEREQYMNQLGPVKPASFGYWLNGKGDLNPTSPDFNEIGI